jgi:hypothetical protein
MRHDTQMRSIRRHDKYIDRLQAENIQLRELLAAYQKKRSCDGLNGSPWDATEHRLAEQEIVRLEQALKRR